MIISKFYISDKIIVLNKQWITIHFDLMIEIKWDIKKFVEINYLCFGCYKGHTIQNLEVIF